MDEKPFDYLTPRQTAEYLKTSTSTLAKLRCYGGGPQYAYRGNRVIYRRDLLDAWISSKIVRSTFEKASAMGSMALPVVSTSQRTGSRADYEPARTDQANSDTQLSFEFDTKGGL